MDEEVFLTEMLLGDRAAVSFCQTLYSISQIADDLYDQDKPISKDDVEEVFWLALVALPNNPFFLKHFTSLQPLIQSMFTDWMEANKLETGSHHEQTIAFVLRDSIGSIATQCAYIIGGYHHGKQAGVQIRRFIHDERLESYRRGIES